MATAKPTKKQTPAPTLPNPELFAEPLAAAAQPTLQIKPLHPNFVAPKYATDGAAGFDLHAIEDGTATPGIVAKVPLGFAAAVPEGHAMLITARSGHGVKFGAGVPQGYGLIDSDYRGEISLVLTVERRMDWSVGDRIAQAIVVPVARVSMSLVDELPDTARGAGGFGSTGDK